ncbi:TetR/AcrR family transcriptional regulator [Nocardia carnea]|uniref:TetR/AcrR family transcriptional regulator n=1 Tax=Nocardia carnea TaxID=37328 RepID=UPI002457EBCD|nr:helix-turn-helix domain-containing protein [Nocardia carnea]
MPTPNHPAGESTDDAAATPSWADRAAERSRSVQRSRARSREQARSIVAAARRLLQTEGATLTTQELSKEAGIALQTFYRHFSGKDQLLLAVFEDVVSERATEVAYAARELPDPVARLRFYLLEILRSLRGEGGGLVGSRFITAEHWRLYQLFPVEIAQANRPFVDLVELVLRAAAAAGLLRPADPATDAWLALQLVTAVFHHYAFAPAPAGIDAVAEQVWAFCLTAFGGPPLEK